MSKRLTDLVKIIKTLSSAAERYIMSSVTICYTHIAFRLLRRCLLSLEVDLSTREFWCDALHTSLMSTSQTSEKLRLSYTEGQSQHHHHHRQHHCGERGRVLAVFAVRTVLSDTSRQTRTRSIAPVCRSHDTTSTYHRQLAHHIPQLHKCFRERHTLYSDVSPVLLGDLRK